jgi:FlaA1/EpsC-like NDP-sugar epimerase
MMGASKKIMEMFLMRESKIIDISTARFANVAFSDGSLLHGFNQRFAKQQPIAAPNDVRRYFVTSQESGELCLMSCLLGDNRDIFFPKLSEQLHLTTFSNIAEKFLINLGYEPYQCADEQEARDRSMELIAKQKWPCYFFKTDTSGEKDFEEFFTGSESLDMQRFKNLGVIKNEAIFDSNLLNKFADGMEEIRSSKTWKKSSILKLFNEMIPDFDHKETGKYLDGRM